MKENVTQRIKQNNLQSVKVVVDGLKDTEMPKFYDPKIPNSSYPELVDRARYQVQRSSILQALIKRTWFRESASTIVESSALDYPKEEIGDYTQLPIWQKHKANKTRVLFQIN